MLQFKRTRILPYTPYSKSAKSLADALEAKRIRLEGTRFVGKEGDLVINWGHSQPLPFEARQGMKLLNSPEAISKVSDKLEFFNHFQGKDWLPRFWTNKEDIPDDAFPVVCRTVLNSHSGRGIVYSSCRDDLVPAPLYVEYIKKKDEYRVHVGSYNDGNGNIEYCTIAIQQKKRNLSNTNPNWRIRNYENGFIYARQNVNPPIGIVQCAVDCIDGSGLDFGAVDVIWNASQSKAYVLEVNSAPGLEGSTVDDYVRYFKGNAESLPNLQESS